jgi:hypothetical protein
MTIQNLIGKTISSATRMKFPSLDDAGFLKLNFTDSTSCIIVADYGQHTGESADEFPTKISVVSHLDGLIPTDAQTEVVVPPPLKSKPAIVELKPSVPPLDLTAISQPNPASPFSDHLAWVLNQAINNKASDLYFSLDEGDKVNVSQRKDGESEKSGSIEYTGLATLFSNFECVELAHSAIHSSGYYKVRFNQMPRRLSIRILGPMDQPPSLATVSPQI